MRKRNTMLTAALLLSLWLAAALPLNVLADDSAPAQPQDAPVVVDDPMDDSPSEEESASLISPDEEPAAADPAADSFSEDPTATQILEAIPEDTDDEEPAAADPAVGSSNEDPTTTQILESIPEDTELVVLDEQGKAISLATVQAADSMSSGVMMWCSSTICTSIHGSFADLVTDLETNSATYSGAGTIYVAGNYDSASAGDSGTTATFNYGSLGLTNALTLQGGWNFSTNSASGVSTIADTNLLFSGWGGTLTFNDLAFDGGYLRVNGGTTADVTLNDVSVTNFNANTDNAAEDVMNAGIGISTTGDIVLNNVNALNNVNGLESTTAAVFALSASGDVAVNGGSFSDNEGEIGLAALGLQTVTLNDVTASGNQNGVYAVGDSILTVNGGQFNYNGEMGLGGASHGDITLNDVTANDNGMYGAQLMTVGVTTVNGGDFSNNAMAGLGIESSGDVILNNVTATGDTAYGAIVMDMGETVSVICGNYNGLGVLGAGDVYLGGPVITGSGLSVFSVGNITYGECLKKVVYDNAGAQRGFIPVTGEAPSCSGEKKVTLKVGDAFGMYENLCGFELTLTALENLPNILPSNMTEIAGVDIRLLLNGFSQGDLPSTGKVFLRLPIPAGSNTPDLVVLFLSGSEWVEVPGGSVIDGFYVVQVEQPGNYILVAR